MAPPGPWAWRERKERIIKLLWNLVPFRFFFAVAEWPRFASCFFGCAPVRRSKVRDTLGINAAQLERRGQDLEEVLAAAFASDVR